MTYFDNTHCQYNKYLKEIDQNRSWRDYENNYGQYKLEKPKNPITIKSIYTEDQSQFFGGNANDDEGEEDIHKFIENSKTLKEKIYEKLERKKKLNKNVRVKITETTFRPNQVPKSNLKQNTISNNLSNRKSLHPQDYSQKKQKTDRKRIMTEIEQANALWKQKSELNLSQMNFYQRQQKTLTKRSENTKRIKDQLKEKEMQGCTFRPQLTKYQPKRN